jgi:hypothetical protein
MLCRKEPFFETSDFPVPNAIQTDLIRDKLLIQSGEHLLFKHDLVRAYFAAHYFSQHWRDGSEIWESTPDRNWLPMLEFVISEAKDGKLSRKLLQRLLLENPDLAGRLFRVMRERGTSFCWMRFTRRFAEEFGRVVLSS